uniref:Uncharacterized protein n=1 Tax=Arundo donax TaxID=35708 RepID=A0A0A9FNV6_ARUDO
MLAMSDQLIIIVGRLLISKFIITEIMVHIKILFIFSINIITKVAIY